jgi:hypothetical protein
MDYFQAFKVRFNIFVLHVGLFSCMSRMRRVGHTFFIGSCTKKHLHDHGSVDLRSFPKVHDLNWTW